MELSKLCHQTRAVVTAVGAFIRQEVGKVAHEQVEDKSVNSLVSYVDRAAEERLVNQLGELAPNSVFLTEENTVENREGEWQWIIDPLDGTTNFLHQLPCFSVSVALRREGQTVLGMVYEINQDECFYAWESSGAFLNDRPIQVARNDQMQHALLATGFPYFDYSELSPYMDLLRKLMEHSRGIRRFGSAAVDLAYVACGRFDAFYEYSLSPWDMAGGAFIVQAAGGLVTDFRAGDDYLSTGKIVAGSPGIQPPLLEMISAIFEGGQQ